MATKATITLHQAAERIGVHYTSLSRRRAKDPGFLPAARTEGNRPYFTAAAVRAAARSVAAHREAASRGVRRKASPGGMSARMPRGE